MHEHLRLRLRVVDQAAVDELQLVHVAAIERDAEMAAEEPFLEQPQIARQQRSSYGRMSAGQRDRLHLQQLRDGGVELRVGVVGVDDVQVGVGAQVFQQQETGVDILRQHAAARARRRLRAGRACAATGGRLRVSGGESITMTACRQRPLPRQ